MIQEDRLKVTGEMLRPLRKSQRKMIVLVVQGIASMARAASLAITSFVSQATGSQLDSALTRFYRVLHNPRVGD